MSSVGVEDEVREASTLLRATGGAYAAAVAAVVVLYVVIVAKILSGRQGSQRSTSTATAHAHSYA